MLYESELSSFKETCMNKALCGIALGLVLSTGCVTSHLPKSVESQDGYYNFTGQQTETWRVEIVDPPVPDTDLDVFYQPKGAPHGIPMNHVPDHPFLFQAEAPKGTPVSFTIEAARGTRQCGSRQVKNRFEYCGQVRLSSNAASALSPQGSRDRFLGQRYRMT
jgi:hypothetical protein